MQRTIRKNQSCKPNSVSRNKSGRQLFI